MSCFCWFWFFFFCPSFSLFLCFNQLAAVSLSLVYTLEWRHGLALGLIQGGGNDVAVRQVDLAVGLLLEAESVVHPGLVVSVGVVLTGVGATGLLAGGGRGGGLGTVQSG